MALTAVHTKVLTQRLRRVDWFTLGALTVYVAVFLVSVAIWGFPLNRERLALWLALGMLAASVRNPKRWARGFLLDWLPLFSVLIAYDFLRGAADELGRPIHMSSLIAFDEWLFGGTVPTVRLQESFLDPDRLYWWDYGAWLVYTSHFVASFVLAAVLWVRSRARFRAYATRLVALSYLGFATYVAYPAAPPWIAGLAGRIPDVERTAARGWDAVGLHTAGAVFEKGQASVNVYAAVPSLHAAYAALICAFLWPTTRRVGRVLLAGYAFAMGLTLVYTAEHWVLDILLGWAYVAVVMVAAALLRQPWRRWKDRWSARLRRAPAGPTQGRRLELPSHTDAGASGPGSPVGARSK